MTNPNDHPTVKSNHAAYMDGFNEGEAYADAIGRTRAQALVTEFHQKYGQPVAFGPVMLTPGRAQLRWSLIAEELEEYVEAVEASNLVDVADALGDLLYVVYGTAVEHGIDMAPVLEEIHRSNMSKLGEDGKPIYREDGKVLKGTGYTPPDLAPIVASQVAEAAE